MPKPLQPTSRDGRKSKRSPKEDSAGTRNRKQEITGSQKEKICTCAKKLLDDAVCGGIVLSDVEVVQKVLQKYADDWGFSDGHFDVLTTEDLCNLSLQVMSLKGPTIGLGSPRSTIDANSPSAHTSIQHGQTTPTQSPAGSPTRSECDQRSQGRVSEEVLDGSIHETESTITAVKGGEHFDIRFFHPDRTKYELLSAERCTEKRSFMSDKVVKRYNLCPDRAKDQSIRLTWKYQDRQTQKTTSTRFWFVKDAMIEASDIVLGSEYDQDDVSDEHSEDLDLESHRDFASDIEDGEEGEPDSESSDDEDPALGTSENEPMYGSDADDEDRVLDDDRHSDDSYIQVSPVNSVKGSLVTNNALHIQYPEHTPLQQFFAGAGQMLTAASQFSSHDITAVNIASQKPSAKTTSCAPRPGKPVMPAEPARPVVRKTRRQTSSSTEPPPVRPKNTRSDRSTRSTDSTKPRRKSGSPG